MNNQKHFKNLILIVISMILFLIALIMGVVSLVINELILGILFIVFLVMGLMLLIFYIVSSKKLSNDLNNLNKHLDELSSGSTNLLVISSDNQDLKEIAWKVNELSITASTIKRKQFYNGKDFHREIQTLVNKGFIDDYAYVRFYDISPSTIDEIVEENHEIYLTAYFNFVDAVIPLSKDRFDFEEYLREKSVVGVKKILLFYSEEFTLEEILDYVKEEKNPDQFNVIHKKQSEYSFNYFIDKYRKVDLYSDTLLDEYLKDILKFLPFSHIGIKVDGEYFRVATFESNSQMDVM